MARPRALPERTPRVQIEYSVGGEKFTLPMVMGVMADFSGDGEAPPVSKRNFLEISADSLDDRLKGIAPRVEFQTKLDPSPEGEEQYLAVDISFESMDDFSPARVAWKIPALRKLLETRAVMKRLISHLEACPDQDLPLAELLQDDEQIQRILSED